MKAWLPGVLILLCHVYSAHAGDPDLGMKRALGLEEAWIEDAVYVSSSRDNDARAGHAWNLGVEWDAVLGERWGAEIDAPGILAQQPLGSGASALAPLTAGLKYLAVSTGDDASENAFVLGVEVEAGWWIRPQPENFPGTGSNVAEQLLFGWRHERYWIQGEYGLSQRAGNDARSGWYANTAIGCRISESLVLQAEIDLNRTSVDVFGHTAYSRMLVPQIGWQISPNWQVIVGESVGEVGNSGSTGVMTNVLIEYGFD